jgi:hypothetical protein
MGVIAFYGTTGEGVQPVLEGYWRRPVHGVYSVVTCKGPYPVLPWMPQTRQARVELDRQEGDTSTGIPWGSGV